jgi:hypothetical protein
VANRPRRTSDTLRTRVPVLARSTGGTRWTTRPDMTLWTYVTVLPRGTGWTYRTRRTNMTLWAFMAILANRSCRTDRSRRTDMARRAVATGRTGRAHRTRVPDRADRSCGTLVNWDFQDIVEMYTDVFVNRISDGRWRCCTRGGNYARGGDRSRRHYSWVFFMFAGFRRFGHSGASSGSQSSPSSDAVSAGVQPVIYLTRFGP